MKANSRSSLCNEFRSVAFHCFRSVFRQAHPLGRGWRGPKPFPHSIKSSDLRGGFGFPSKAELVRPTGKAFPNRFPPANPRRDLRKPAPFPNAFESRINGFQMPAPPKAELVRPTGKAFPNRFPPANPRRDLRKPAPFQMQREDAKQIPFASEAELNLQII